VREDKLVEKQFRKLENRLEADYATLRAENKELVERQRHDKWTIHGLLTRMEMMEARMALVSVQVAAIRPRFWRAINRHRFSHFAHPSPSFGR